MKKVYKSSEGTTAPLSGAVEMNGFVFVSGQIHADETGKLQGNSIEDQFDAVVSNIKKVLHEAGLGLENIVRVNLYLTDLTQLPELNKIYGKYFRHPFPARTAIGVAALPLGACLEMDVVAAR